MATSVERSHGRKDLRNLAAYSVAEAAGYLGLPSATLRTWVLGRPYQTARGPQRFRPLVDLADPEGGRLSFFNLVEAHVLAALRRGEPRIALPKVRAAIDYLKKALQSERPLLDPRLRTDGLDLFVHEFGRLVNVSREGQYAMRELLDAHLRRIDRDAQGRPARLYLFTRRGEPDEPRRVVVDPSVRFGQPTLEGTSIPTAVIAERFKAGDSPEELAEDYGRPREEIEEALRYELRAA